MNKRRTSAIKRFGEVVKRGREERKERKKMHGKHQTISSVGTTGLESRE